jgi:hypothetical protein
VYRQELLKLMQLRRRYHILKIRAPTSIPIRATKKTLEFKSWKDKTADPRERGADNDRKTHGVGVRTVVAFAYTAAA